MFKTEETRVAAAIAASFGLLCVWLVLDMFNVLGMAIALVAIALFMLFTRFILKKNPGNSGMKGARGAPSWQPGTVSWSRYWRCRRSA